jgi:hypothetical protein
VRAAGINVCCGGIVGIGEAAEDRVGMIATLAGLPVHPESVPINMLVQVEGTPLASGAKLDALEFVRTVAVARITMPKSMVRLSAGREDMSEEKDASSVLPRRRQLDLLRPQAPHRAQSGARSRHGPARQARPAADATLIAPSGGDARQPFPKISCKFPTQRNTGLQLVFVDRLAEQLPATETFERLPVQPMTVQQGPRCSALEHHEFAASGASGRHRRKQRRKYPGH